MKLDDAPGKEDEPMGHRRRGTRVPANVPRNTDPSLLYCPLSVEGMAQGWRTREDFDALYAQGPPMVVDMGEGYFRPWIKPPPETPSRQELRAICAKALDLPEKAWMNRDSSAAVRQLGEAYALLSAGCDIVTIERDMRLRTWWVTFAFRGFNYFEGTGDGMGDLDEERYYIPFLDKVKTGEDWY